LKGFTHFQTPSGRSSLVDEGPFHWGIDYVTVYFKGVKETLQTLLPEGLSIADGMGMAYIGDFVSVSERSPETIYLDPAQTIYHEAAIGVACNYQGRPGLYFIFMWVDRDWSLIRGWLNGYPKKMADEIAMTKLHPLNPLTGGIKIGSNLSGYATRHGQRIFTVRVKITRKGTAEDVTKFGSTYGLRLFPATDSTQTQVRELVEVKKSAAVVDDVWVGDGELSFGTPLGEELDLLGPLAIKYGCSYRTGFTISGAKVLAKIP
jgi:acetoacetate decarboxylase